MRNYTLDIIRVLAMVGVVFDHYLQRSDDYSIINTGLWTGGVCVAIFLAISSYLYGLQWRKMEYKGINVKEFLTKRCLRIFIPLWLTLLLVIPIELHVGHKVSAQMIVFNLLGLGWIRPLMWQGHLWYITMTVFIYALFLAISRFRSDKIPLGMYVSILIVLTGIIITFPSVFCSVSRVVIPFTLLYATMIFALEDKILKICKTYKWQLLFISIIVAGCSFYLYILGWHYSHKGIATLSSAWVGLLFFLSLMTFVSIGEHKFISWISDRSYEIYLVHPSVICVMASFVGKGWINILLGLVIIAIVGYALNSVCRRIYKFLKY